MKAVINGDRIECGKCRALLFKFNRHKHVPCEDGTPADWRDANKIISGKYGTAEIKCKHKSQGKYCDEINEILL